jgi:hypothetical protein
MAKEERAVMFSCESYFGDMLRHGWCHIHFACGLKIPAFAGTIMGVSDVLRYGEGKDIAMRLLRCAPQ